MRALLKAQYPEEKADNPAAPTAAAAPAAPAAGDAKPKGAWGSKFTFDEGKAAEKAQQQRAGRNTHMLNHRDVFLVPMHLGQQL